jgi:hypothetical protein
MSNVSKQNLLRIDSLAEKFNILDNSDVLLDSNNSITLSPVNKVSIGTANRHVTEFVIYADLITFPNPTFVSGLQFSYSDLDFTFSSLNSIEDHDTVISENPDVIAATAHVNTVGNPHMTTASQVGAYSTSQMDSLLADKTDYNYVNTQDNIVRDRLYAHITELGAHGLPVDNIDGGMAGSIYGGSDPIYGGDAAGV